jgi:N-acetylneuraminate epimerase
MSFLTWEVMAELPVLNGHTKSPGLAGMVTGVHENRLILSGGCNFPLKMPWEGGKKKYYGEVYVFNNEGGIVSLHHKQFKLPVNIAYAATCSTVKGVFWGGGENEEGISRKTFLLYWDRILDETVVSALPDLPVPLTNAAAASNDRYVYVAGGSDGLRSCSFFMRLDLDNLDEGWLQLPALPIPVSYGVLLFCEDDDVGGILIIGGKCAIAKGKHQLVRNVFEYKLDGNDWEHIADLPYAIAAGCGVVLKNRSVLLFGGDKGETSSLVEDIIYKIDQESNESVRQKMIEQKNQIQQLHPGFSNDVLLFDLEAKAFSFMDSIPFKTPVTTAAMAWYNDIIIPGGEIMAGVRTPFILRGKFNVMNK